MNPILMRIRRLAGTCGLVAALALLGFPALADDVRSLPALFAPRAENATEVASIAGKKWARSRPVDVNAAVLESLRAGNAGRIAFATFDGESHVLNLTERTGYGPRGDLLSGDVEGLAGSSVQLFVAPGFVSLGVNIPQRRPYALRRVGEGRYRLCEVDLLAGKSVATTTAAPPPLASGYHVETHAGSRRDAAPAGNTVGQPTLVDVMILYTPAAQSAAGGQQAIEAECFKAIGLANGAHGRSGTGVVLRAVHVALYDYTEDSDVGSSMLTTLSGKSDITTLAKAHGADLVAVLVERTGGSNGIGYRPTTLGGIPGSMCIAKWDHAYSGMTFAHETGHNFGCGHDAAHGDGLFSYSHGYSMPPAAPLFRTVMADDDTGFVTRVPFFSNPNVDFVDPLGVHYTTGDATTADNARTIRETSSNARQNRAPTNAFYAYANCTTCASPPLGDGSVYSPATRLNTLFGGTLAGNPIDGILSWVGFAAADVANIYMDSSVVYPEKIRITRPCRLMKWDSHGTGNVRITPN